MKVFNIWARAKDQGTLLRKMARILGQDTGWRLMAKGIEIDDLDLFLKINRGKYQALEIHAIEIKDCPGKIEPTTIPYASNEQLDAALRDWFDDPDWDAELDQLIEEEREKK